MLASPPGLSQRATSFIASQCQGIHQMPFISRLSTTPNGKYQNCIAAEPSTADAAISLEDTCRTRRLPASQALQLKSQTCRACPPRSHSLIHPSINEPQQRRRSTNAANGYFMPSGIRGSGSPPSPPKWASQNGGGERDRTDDLLLAKQALSQLSYTPVSDRRRQKPGQRGFAAPRPQWFCI